MSLALLCVFYVALWMIATPYFGLNHDAQAYAAAALATLDHHPLAGDLFLRYRSQDEFSLFPAFYGWMIGKLGLEPAAALLCAISQFVWFAAAAGIATTLLGARLGFLALGLLIALPQPYGAQRVFHLAEPFLTARLPAEALALLALLAYLQHRRLLAVLLAVAAVAIHPLMGCAVVLLLAFLEVTLRAQRMLPPAALCLGVVTAAVVGSLLIHSDTSLMTGQWLAVTKLRSSFLFLDGWQWYDWNNLLLCVLLTGFSMHVLRERTQVAVASATLWLAATGLVLMVVITYLAPLATVVQGQPWRWFWPARLMSTILLPGIFATLWPGRPVERACALFVASGCLLFVNRTNPSALVQLSPALLTGVGVAAWALRDRLAVSGRTVWYAGLLVASAVLVAGILRTAASLIGGGTAGQLSAPLQVLRAIGNSTLPLVLAVLCAWLLSLRGRTSQLALGLAGAALLLLLAPPAVAEWRRTRFSELQRAAFEPWARSIPADAEVLWLGDRLHETWFVLQRQSYLSRSQSGGVVFSPELTSEVIRRALVLAPVTDPGYWIAAPGATDPNSRPLTRSTLAEICQDPELGFVVADHDLGDAVLRGPPSPQGSGPFLYSCATYHERQR